MTRYEYRQIDRVRRLLSQVEIKAMCDEQEHITCEILSVIDGLCGELPYGWAWQLERASIERRYGNRRHAEAHLSAARHQPSPRLP